MMPVMLTTMVWAENANPHTHTHTHTQTHLCIYDCKIAHRSTGVKKRAHGYCNGGCEGDFPVACLLTEMNVRDAVCCVSGQRTPDSALQTDRQTHTHEHKDMYAKIKIADGWWRLSAGWMGQFVCFAVLLTLRDVYQLTDLVWLFRGTTDYDHRSTVRAHWQAFRADLNIEWAALTLLGAIPVFV